MAKILYNSTTGYIVGVFLDSETVTPPAGHTVLSEVGTVLDFIEKQVDIAGPSVVDRDYLQFTGNDSQLVSTVETHGVQKYNGVTQLITATASDTDAVIFQLGNVAMLPGTDQGFIEDEIKNLVLGAVSTRLASGNIAGDEYIHVRAGHLGTFSKNISYT